MSPLLPSNSFVKMPLSPSVMNMKNKSLFHPHKATVKRHNETFSDRELGTFYLSSRGRSLNKQMDCACTHTETCGALFMQWDAPK